MKGLLAGLTALLISCTSIPAQAVPELGMYVAIINSPDVAYYFDDYPKYTRDYEATMGNWQYLDEVLQQIKERSHGQKVFFDFMVHGANSGLYLQTRMGPFRIHSRASFGYVLNRIHKYFPDNNFILCFESCYPAAAYKNTIRGAKVDRPDDKIEDYKYGVPNFPIYGVGDGYSNIGPVMYQQQKYHFHKWWWDLREWDSKGKNKSLVTPQDPYFEDMNAMEENILYVSRFLMDHIP